VEAYPPNVTYYWYQGDNLISSAIFSSATQFEVSKGIVGEFSCQALNLAGLGPKCSVQISDPALELLQEEDLTLLTFGIIFISVFLVSLILSVVFCRRKNEEKYEITVIHEVQDDLTIKTREEKTSALETKTLKFDKSGTAKNNKQTKQAARLKQQKKNEKKNREDEDEEEVATATLIAVETSQSKSKRRKNGFVKTPTELWLV